MTELHLQTMRDAEALCECCRAVSGKPLLRAGVYCVDAASTLGALALVYGNARPILLDASLIPDILLYAGERGLEGALQSLSVESVFLDVEDKGALMDADTPKEYFEVRQYYENESIEDLKP